MRKESPMLAEKPKKLPKDIDMPCYSCKKQIATHVCRYKIGDLVIQVCICQDCMKMDLKRLLKTAIGIHNVSESPICNYSIEGTCAKFDLFKCPHLHEAELFDTSQRGQAAIKQGIKR